MTNAVSSDRFFSDCFFVNSEKLGNEKLSFHQSKLDRKINLKLNKADVQVLDLISEHYNVSRSVIINEILYKILLEEFQGIGDIDTKYLLAMMADEGKEYSPYAYSWEETLLQEFGCPVSIDPGFSQGTYFVNCDEIPHSETFKKIYSRLKSANVSGLQGDNENKKGE